MEMEEIYAEKVSGTYPYNLLKNIFGREAENTEDAQKGAELEKMLSEIIELRLTNEEKTVLFKVYRDGKSLAEIAEEQRRIRMKLIYIWLRRSENCATRLLQSC